MTQDGEGSLEMAIDQDALTKTARLGLRTSEYQRALLVAASHAESTTVSEFVLKYATRAAEDVLADRRVFMLSAERWDAFVDALDAPERELPRLRKLFESTSVLEEG
jgi:uncharacterized protein (DUF1778 family)